MNVKKKETDCWTENKTLTTTTRKTGFSFPQGRKLVLLMSDAECLQLESTITCPHCAGARTEAMPTDACQIFYECSACQTVLRPHEGDCYVFCSFWVGRVPAYPGTATGQRERGADYDWTSPRMSSAEACQSKDWVSDPRSFVLAWGAPRHFVTRGHFCRSLRENPAVDRSLDMERKRVRSECRPVWTDALLFYRTLLPSAGCRNSSLRIPDRRPWSEWLDVVRPGDHCGWRVHMDDHRKSVGEISFCPELTEECTIEPIDRR